MKLRVVQNNKNANGVCQFQPRVVPTLGMQPKKNKDNAKGVG